VRASSRSTKSRFDPSSAVVLVAFALAYALVALIRGVPWWIDAMYAGASVVCFAVYGIDKFAARGGRDRVPEAMLLWLGVVGGWPGAVVAQQAFRHKTVKRRFRVLFWLTVVVNVVVLAWATLASGYPG
jgi:uncharacterized membrane protein YsdA (DUF1294 family)